MLHIQEDVELFHITRASSMRSCEVRAWPAPAAGVGTPCWGENMSKSWPSRPHPLHAEAPQVMKEQCCHLKGQQEMTQAGEFIPSLPDMLKQLFFVQGGIFPPLAFPHKWFDRINLRFPSSQLNCIVCIKLWEKFRN